MKSKNQQFPLALVSFVLSVMFMLLFGIVASPGYADESGWGDPAGLPPPQQAPQTDPAAADPTPISPSIFNNAANPAMQPTDNQAIPPVNNIFPGGNNGYYPRPTSETDGTVNIGAPAVTGNDVFRAPRLNEGIPSQTRGEVHVLGEQAPSPTLPAATQPQEGIYMPNANKPDSIVTHPEELSQQSQSDSINARPQYMPDDNRSNPNNSMPYTTIPPINTGDINVPGASQPLAQSINSAINNAYDIANRAAAAITGAIGSSLPTPQVEAQSLEAIQSDRLDAPSQAVQFGSIPDGSSTNPPAPADRPRQP